MWKTLCMQGKLKFASKNATHCWSQSYLHEAAHGLFLNTMASGLQSSWPAKSAAFQLGWTAMS
jgi:hypothetical protein